VVTGAENCASALAVMKEQSISELGDTFEKGSSMGVLEGVK
jgi:hypothetical protein